MHVSIITPITTKGELSADQIKSLCQNGLTVSVTTLDYGPLSIGTRVDTAFVIPGMIATAQREEERGAKAIVIDCKGDPGMDVLREVVDIPVLGVTQTSMAICASLADRLGIVTILDRTIPMIEDLVNHYGHKGRYTGCRSVNVSSLEVKPRLEEVKDMLAEEALEMVKNEGADAVILGCTGFIGCAEAVKDRLHAEGFNVPVVEPLPATLFSAIPLIRLNLTQSRKSFPKYEARLTLGYDFLGLSKAPSAKLQ